MQIEGFSCPTGVSQEDIQRLTMFWNNLDEQMSSLFDLNLVPESVLISSFAFCILVRNEGIQSNAMVANLIQRIKYEERCLRECVVIEDVPQHPGMLGIEFPRKDETPLDVQNLKAEIQTADYQLPIVLGESSLGKPVIVDIADLMMLSIMGGDTCEQDNLIPFFDELSKIRDNSYWKYVMITGNGLTWDSVMPKSHIWKNGVVCLDSGNTNVWQKNYKMVMNELERELDVRLRLLSSLGVESIEKLNYQSRVRLPHILVFAVDICNGLEERIEEAFYGDYFELMSPESKKAGIHLVLVDFKPRPDLYHEWGSVMAAANGLYGHDGNVGRIMITWHWDDAVNSMLSIGGPEAIKYGWNKFLYRSPHNEFFRIKTPTVLKQE